MTLLCAEGQAHEFFSTKITWTREVSRIVAKSCLGCHREGGKAFSLATFDDARPWAKAIKEEVLNRRMPPWGAVKGFGAFADDRGLSQDEIGLIADWVEGGSPEGDRNYLPKMKTATDGSAAGAGKPRAWRNEQLLSVSAPLAAPLTLAGIAPRGPVPAGTQVMAELPDGSVEPLIWILEPKAAVLREFVYRKPVTFPAGTRFTVSRAGGQWKLLTKATAAASATTP